MDGRKAALNFPPPLPSYMALDEDVIGSVIKLSLIGFLVVVGLTLLVIAYVALV